MKIAITGTHRVGKTTLAEKLLGELPGYTLGKEPYYMLEESGHLFAEEPDVDDFVAQFNCAVAQLQASEDNVIFDRSPIDLLAYIYALDAAAHRQTYYETAQQAASAIDFLVWIPIEEPDRIQLLPSDLPELRWQVDDLLQDWIADWGIPTIEVSGTVQHRKDQVLKKIAEIAIAKDL